MSTIAKEQIMQFVANSKSLAKLCDEYSKKGTTVHLKELVGGAFSMYAAATAAKVGGVHIFVAADRDAAAYMLNDFYELLDEKFVYFFPSSYKRSIVYATEDAQGMVQRTTTMNGLRNFTDGYMVICTYPEALVESVVDIDALQKEILKISIGDTISIDLLVETLVEADFERVDFVYQPGQYSQRGGIVDIFSYVESRPYRIDFFGDDVDSIRRFNISSQLSVDKLESVDIIPNLNNQKSKKVSFAHFAGEEATYWFYDADYTFQKINNIRKKYLSELEDPSTINEFVTSRNKLLTDLDKCRIFTLRDNLNERLAESTIEFKTSHQPKFNKNFELLADDIIRRSESDFKTYILSNNRAQLERLQNIFQQSNRGHVAVNPLYINLHEGFIDKDLKMCFYTDHQIFDRYQRYRINGEIKRDEQMTVAELNRLQMGDYVVHIDHGVGRFGGLVKIDEGGKMHEAIKLVYKDSDILFVNVHSLHRISRYKSGEGEAPKIHKLGGGVWLKLKNATKKAIKDISRELIKLYAERKASKGFAFSADTYIQQELEASFIWEDTPDQQSATAAIKADMESDQPMDRLVCGDVGFGKTEVAIRAALKAATDGKQVAVLVPTTILALQHYRSFTQRLKEFPVRVEYVNRLRSAKDMTQIYMDLESGKIDILIGTHKILSKQIKFNDLGLLIIDEEQKFGVAAKEKLTKMSVNVDTLTLTATPIPRTLQFSLMGSRDLSTIATPPPNRQPIVTESILFSEDVIRDAIEEELARGGQVYFVHNRVDDMPKMKSLINKLCPKARVEVGHGRLGAAELEKLIMNFIYGEFDILLATTIIENGIDIPNANTIIINNAQNFGLSDLHQLRGRVGRSDKKAYCYLLSPPEEFLTSEARRRLRAIEEFSDLGSGFNIAMQDLDIRGAGNLLGAEQSGFIADIGIETYHKILNEAIAELKTEGLNVDGLSNIENNVVDQMQYVDDVSIEIDGLAELPDNYVGQQAEKLRLYRELDNLKDEESLLAYESRLVDRFGPLPEPAKELIYIVRLRWEAMRLGMERVKVKNGLMIVQFVGDNNSPYYKSEIFMDLLKKVTQQPNRFVLKQNNNRLRMTVRKVENIEKACEVLKTL